MLHRILAFWVILCIGCPLCCCNKPVPSAVAKTISHECCAQKQEHDKKEQGGGSEQCPHKKSNVVHLAETGIMLPSIAVHTVEVLPAWMDAVCSDVIHARSLLSHDAQRWREWVAAPGSLSFCIRYRALLI